MKDKSVSIILGFGIAMAVLVGMLFFIAKSGKLEFIEYVYFLVILVVLAFSFFILWKKSKDIKAGLPVSDELATKTGWKAGYYAYIFTVWLAVGLLWYNIIIPERFGVSALTVEHVIGLIVLIPGAVFFGLFTYFSKKGDVQ